MITYAGFVLAGTFAVLATIPATFLVWGVVTGHTLYLYSERRTVKARNLAAEPRVMVHLESGEDVAPGRL